MGESPRHPADFPPPPTFPRPPPPSFLRRQEPRQTDHPQHFAGPPFALSLSKRPPQEAPPRRYPPAPFFVVPAQAGTSPSTTSSPAGPHSPHRRSRPSFRRSRAGGNLPLRDHQHLPPRSPPPSYRRKPVSRGAPGGAPRPPTPRASPTSAPPRVIPAQAGIQRSGARPFALNPSPPPPLSPRPPAVLSCPPTGQTGGHTCQPSE